MLNRAFECPVAKKTVIFSIRLREVRSGFPPVREFAGCTGLSECGVESRGPDGATYNWSLCPLYSSMNR